MHRKEAHRRCTRPARGRRPQSETPEPSTFEAIHKASQDHRRLSLSVLAQLTFVACGTADADTTTATATSSSAAAAERTSTGGSPAGRAPMGAAGAGDPPAGGPRRRGPVVGDWPAEAQALVAMTFAPPSRLKDELAARAVDGRQDHGSSGRLTEKEGRTPKRRRARTGSRTGHKLASCDDRGPARMTGNGPGMQARQATLNLAACKLRHANFDQRRWDRLKTEAMACMPAGFG